jgi:2-dehydro-3-deoxyphosphogluconate aldolase/(4S)-4-hydroxy-2-oxoglutarate aldolase
MNKHEAKSRILKCGLLPVVRADDAEQAVGICEALVEGNVDVVEVTMTVPGAIKVMERIVDTFGDRIVMGAGTVLDEQTARNAILAGAEFIVSPGTSRAVVETANRYSKIVCPGALTPTEVLTAWEMGVDFVKVFPCGEVGGAKYIKSLKAPYQYGRRFYARGMLGTWSRFSTGGQESGQRRKVRDYRGECKEIPDYYRRDAY